VQAALKFHHTQKTLLHGIFSVVVISQNGPAYAENHPHMLRSQGFNLPAFSRSITGLCPDQDCISKNCPFGHFAILKRRTAGEC
jgi:hypothetical protein